MKQKHTVCIIGVFPPPIHGLSLVNDAMRKLILNIDHNSSVFDLSSLTLNRTFYNISIRFIKFLYIYPKYIILSLSKRYHTLYLGLSGGHGQFYDLLILIIAKITRQRIFIHHHSFSYLNKINLITYLVIWIAGLNATHIVLCTQMQKRLKRYRNNLSCKLLSNSVFSLDNNIMFSKNRKLKTIGFLGNISIKKGIKIFFDILDKLNHDNAVKGIIGGPFQDNKSKIFTINEVKKYSYISYLGPLYFKKKEEFFNSIDVLLMPSILEEAEPLVIHEGMSHGIPVIAYDKGCIKEIIRNDQGLVVDLNQNFIKHAVNLLNNWIDDPNLFNEIRANALNSYIKTKEVSKISLENILSQITNNLND